LQSAKARLQWIDSIQVYSSTMNVFIGHPLQSDLSDCTMRFTHSIPGICYKWCIQIPIAIGIGIVHLVTLDLNPGWLRSFANRRGFLLQSAKARLQWIDSIQVYSFTMNEFLGHPLQSDLSDCPIRFIPIWAFSRFLYPMVFDVLYIHYLLDWVSDSTQDHFPIVEA